MQYLVYWKHSRNTKNHRQYHLCHCHHRHHCLGAFLQGNVKNALVGRDLLIYFENPPPVSTRLSPPTLQKSTPAKFTNNLFVAKSSGKFFTHSSPASLQRYPCARILTFGSPLPLWLLRRCPCLYSSQAFSHYSVSFLSFLSWLHKVRVGILQGSGTKHNSKI